MQPIQTNEVARSAALLGGFLLVAKTTGLPLRLLEIGASAGLNLRWDYYRYEAGTFGWGDPASPVRFVDIFAGGAPPLHSPAKVAQRTGCDLTPVDPASHEGRLTLLSYAWADQTQRLELLCRALEVARQVPVSVDRADAADWLAGKLVDPSPGLATVIFHSIVMQYLSPATREKVQALLEDAGRQARREAPVARLALEPAGDLTEIHLTVWPGGHARLIARAGYHGWPVIWLVS